MEELFNEFSNLNQYIDWLYLSVFMLFAYRLKTDVAAALNWNKTAVVFCIGTIVAIPFWFWFHIDRSKLLVTYAVGTSLHELIIGFLIKKAKTYWPDIFNKDNAKK